MRTFFRTSFIAVGVAFVCVGLPDVFAADVVYKCKDAQGKLIYTDSPCVGRSKMVTYSKATERHHQFKQQQAEQVKRFRAERIEVARRNAALRSNSNASAVN